MSGTLLVGAAAAAQTVIVASEPSPGPRVVYLGPALYYDPRMHAAKRQPWLKYFEELSYYPLRKMTPSTPNRRARRRLSAMRRKG